METFAYEKIFRRFVQNVAQNIIQATTNPAAAVVDQIAQQQLSEFLDEDFNMEEAEKEIKLCIEKKKKMEDEEKNNVSNKFAKNLEQQETNNIYDFNYEEAMKEIEECIQGTSGREMLLKNKTTIDDFNYEEAMEEIEACIQASSTSTPLMSFTQEITPLPENLSQTMSQISKKSRVRRSQLELLIHSKEYYEHKESYNIGSRKRQSTENIQDLVDSDNVLDTDFSRQLSVATPAPSIQSSSSNFQRHSSKRSRTNKIDITQRYDANTEEKVKVRSLYEFIKQARPDLIADDDNVDQFYENICIMYGTLLTLHTYNKLISFDDFLIAEKGKMLNLPKMQEGMTIDEQEDMENLPLRKLYKPIEEELELLKPYYKHLEKTRPDIIAMEGWTFETFIDKCIMGQSKQVEPEPTFVQNVITTIFSVCPPIETESIRYVPSKDELDQLKPLYDIFILERPDLANKCESYEDFIECCIDGFMEPRFQQKGYTFSEFVIDSIDFMQNIGEDIHPPKAKSNVKQSSKKFSRPSMWGDLTIADLRETFNKYEELSPEFREFDYFFDPHVPIFDVRVPLRLPKDDFKYVQKDNNDLHYTVVFQYMMHIVRSSKDVPIAVLHPIISEYFIPNAQRTIQEHMRLPNDEIPDACELTYGKRSNFQILLIPIYQDYNRHFTLAIADVRKPSIIFFDPLQHVRSNNLMFDWHKNLLQHIRKTIYPGRWMPKRPTLKGDLIPAPYRSYNQQIATVDNWTCGHRICFIAERYVLGQNTYVHNFNPRHFRIQMERVLEPVMLHFYPDVYEHIPIEDDPMEPQKIPEQSVIFESSQINFEGRRISTRVKTSTQRSQYTPPTLEAERRARYRGQLPKQKDSQKKRADLSTKDKERRKRKFDPNEVELHELYGEINYGNGEIIDGDVGCAIIQHYVFPDYYDSGDFDVVCEHCEARLLKQENSGLCCANGAIKLPIYTAKKKGYLEELLQPIHPDHQNFIANVKNYNNFVSFCSIASAHPRNKNLYHGQKDLVIINGEVRHNISDVEAPPGKLPMFLQLYVIEPNQSREFRLKNPLFERLGCNIDIAMKLENDIRTYHPFATQLQNQYRQYLEETRVLRQKAEDEGIEPNLIVPRCRINLVSLSDAPIKAVGRHPGTVNLPTDQVTIAWIADKDEPPRRMGTWVANNTGRLRQIPVWDPNLDSLAYPLIFQQGERGFEDRTWPLNPKKPSTMSSSMKKDQTKDSSVTNILKKIILPRNKDSSNKRKTIKDHIHAVDAMDSANTLLNDANNDDDTSIVNSTELVNVDDPNLAVSNNGDDVDFGDNTIDDNVDDNAENLVTDSEEEPDDNIQNVEPYGDTGVVRGKKGKRKYVSRRQFDRYHLMRRSSKKNIAMAEIRHHVYQTKTLGQQFIIDHYLRDEYCKLNYYNKLQEKYRHDNEADLRKAIEKQLKEGEQLGKVFLMSRNHIGGRNYYQQKLMDCSTVYDQIGEANFMITFTLNPSLPEIQRNLKGLKYVQAPDITCRYFQDKVKELYRDIKDRGIFGECIYVMGGREWQHRSLSHVHWNVKLHPKHVRKTAEWANGLVCAEIPEEPHEDDTSREANMRRLLRKLVLKLQVHKCNSNSRCWDTTNNCCRKKFPRHYSNETDISGRFPIYRRRAPSGHGVNEKHTAYIELNGKTIRITNADIVPYNPYILLKYMVHHCMNIVEGRSALIYSLNYILKGNDASVITVERAINEQGTTTVQYNEPKAYKLARTTGPNEAIDRIFSYFVVKSTYSVETLPLHLPNQATLVFESTTTPANLASTLKEKVTSRLVAFLRQCQNPNEIDADSGEHLFKDTYYQDLPHRFTWVPTKKQWKKRDQRFTRLGRIQVANPLNTERYALRLLLKHTPFPAAKQGQDIFDGLKTVEGKNNGLPFSTFNEAAHERGLIYDDLTWEATIKDLIAINRSSWRLRSYYARMMVNCGYGPPILKLWNKYEEHFIPPARAVYRNEEEEQNHLQERRNLALLHLWFCVRRMLNGKDLTDYGFDISHLREEDLARFEHFPSFPDEDVVVEDMTHPIHHINDFEPLTDEERAEIEAEIEKLEHEQRDVFWHIVGSFFVSDLGEKIYPHFTDYVFIQGTAGTGKTYLLNLLDKVLSRLDGKNVLFCAYTGVAATLLPRGQTIHSTFKINPKVTLPAAHQLSFTDPVAERLRNADIIFIDEVAQVDKKILEHINKILQDLGDPFKPFGGKKIVLSGDFQQALPVVRSGGIVEQVEASIQNSDLYQHFRTYVLTKPQRTDPQEMDFFNLLQEIGTGATTDPDGSILLPASMFVNSLQELHDFVYADNALQDSDQLKNVALLAPKNDAVFEENDRILEKMIGGDNNKTYYFYATDKTLGTDGTVLQENTDIWNGTNPTGLPKYCLKLKVGAIVMLVRNVSVADGLTNGTRLTVRQIINNRVVLCEVVTGKAKGRVVEFCPYRFEYYDTEHPMIHFERTQIPLRLAFSMTISKAQGQTLCRCGLNLSEHVFTHGQLFVGISRVRRQVDIKIYMPKPYCSSKKDDPPGYVRVKNVVVREILQHLI